MTDPLAPLVAQRYLDVAACAVYLGRSQDAVRHMVKRGQIPHRKWHGRVIFDREELDRCFHRQPGITAAEALKRSA